jgi:hypothetical protein
MNSSGTEEVNVAGNSYCEKTESGRGLSSLVCVSYIILMKISVDKKCQRKLVKSASRIIRYLLQDHFISTRIIRSS